MLIEFEWGPYNERRYSKPWAARVTAWPVGQRQPDVEWGTFIGNSDEGGIVEIEAEPGDIVRWGQRDQRNPRKSESRIGEVQQEIGNIEELSISEARTRWRKREKATEKEKTEDVAIEIRQAPVVPALRIPLSRVPEIREIFESCPDDAEALRRLSEALQAPIMTARQSDD